MLGQTVRCSNEKMPAAARRIAHLQAQDGLGSVGLLQGLSHDRFEGRIEQTLHQALRRVVTTRRLALAATHRLEVELSRLNVYVWQEFQQCFVHTTELF